MWAAMIFFQKSEKKKKEKNSCKFTKPLTDSSPRSILRDNMGFEDYWSGTVIPTYKISHVISKYELFRMSRTG